MSKCGARQAIPSSSLIGWLIVLPYAGELKGEFDTPELALQAGILDAKGLLAPAELPI
jgi:hypothetical protein